MMFHGARTYTTLLRDNTCVVECSVAVWSVSRRAGGRACPVGINEAEAAVSPRSG